MPPPIPTGPTILVSNGAALQAALNTITGPCEIRCDPAGTYTGNFVLRNVTVPIGEWIIVRADSPDSAFDPNTAVGMPACVLPAQAGSMAKLSSFDTFQPTLTADDTAHNYYFYGLEFLPNTAHPDRDLVTIGNGRTSVGQLPHHLTFDSCLFRGDATVGGHRGIRFDVVSGVLIACYFKDFFYGQDSQCALVIDGAGPYLYESNYFEAAGENILFGGGDPSIANQLPTDLTIRKNYFFKPLAWRAAGWQVKNLFELKLADGAVVEDNVFQNVWASGQDGCGVLFTVRNQEGHAPWSTVKDVNFRYNIIQNCQRAAFNMLGIDDSQPSVQGTNVAISHVLILDVSTGFLINRGYRPTSITHCTIPTLISQILQFTEAPLPANQFTMQNCITGGSQYGISADSTASGTPALNAFAPGAVFDHNVIEEGPDFVPFPSGNTLLANGTLAAFFESDYTYTGPGTPTSGVMGADIAALKARIPWWPWTDPATDRTVSISGEEVVTSAGDIGHESSSVIQGISGVTVLGLVGSVTVTTPDVTVAVTGTDLTWAIEDLATPSGGDATSVVFGIEVTTAAGTVGTSVSVELTGTDMTAAAGSVETPVAAAVGDIVYRGTALWKRLEGNATTDLKVLSQTGDGVDSAAPTWATVGSGIGTVTTTGSPASGNLAKFSGSTSITNADLTGDVTTSGGVATTLATVNSNVGTFGDGTHVAQVTVTAKGLVTAASNVAITNTGTVTHTAGALTANQLVIGNGTADITVLGTLGTTTTLLHGNAAGAPTFGAVSLTADVSGDLPFSSFVQSSAASKLVGRGSASGAGDFQEITLGSNLSMSGTTLSASGTTGTAGLIGIQTFTTSGSGTYTPTSGTNSIVIELQGAGGGGSGVGTPGVGNVSLGGGGYGGGYLFKRLTASFSGATYSVGAKGTGGSAGANNGADGGDTTFTDTAGSPTTYTAKGGVKGTPLGPFTPPFQFNPSTGAATSGGDVNIQGGSPFEGFTLSTTNGVAQGGGVGYFSRGGLPPGLTGTNQSTAGNVASDFGGGGSGAIATGTGGTKAGGNGSDGLIRIWEYS